MSNNNFGCSYCDFDQLLQEMFAERWLSPRTEASYRGPVKIFRNYIGLETLPSEVTRRDVLAWRRSIVVSSQNLSGIAETSWNNYARHLKSIYRFGMTSELINIQKSPFEGVFIKEMKKGRKTLNETDIGFAREAVELCRRFEVVKGEPAPIHPAWFWRTVLETFYHTGIRLNQLLHLTPNDVHLKKRRLTASAKGAKNSFESILPITDQLYPHLVAIMTSAQAAGCKRDEQLFNVNRFSVRTKRDIMDGWQVARFFARLSRYCGSRITPHRFRHTLATDLMRSQASDLYLTQQVCGHTDIRSTMAYINPDIDALRRYLDQRHSYKAIDPLSDELQIKEASQ